MDEMEQKGALECHNKENQQKVWETSRELSTGLRGLILKLPLEEGLESG